MADRTLTINHADGGSETYTINRDKFAGVRALTIDGDNVSIYHTAVPKEQAKETTFGGSQSITVNRDIEPLLSKVVGGAAAAYSLRDLNDSQGNNNVVRVRRESDNSEKDFKAKEVSNGTMARWVNEQPTLPLDLRELDTNTGERDGALIEATAAYSLRKLSAEGTDVQPSGDSPIPVADNTDLFLPDDFPVTLQRNDEGYFIKETGADWFANYVGATLYVSPSGNDATGDGSSSNPYQSLNTVISNASDNDVINMSAGIYAMPALAVSKDLAFVCPSGKAYIGTFNDLSSAQIDAIDYSGTTLHNVDDVVTGETFKGWIRTDGTLVGGVRGSAVSGTNGQAIDYQNFGVMSVYAGSDSANFSTGTSETLQELVNAGSVLAWSDADTDRFRVATGTSVYIGENITLASYGTDVVTGIGSANLILDGCEIYGGSNNCVSHPSSGSVIMFNTLVAGSNQDNIDYRGTAIAVESNITSNWCNTGASDNTSTGHDSCKVLRVGGTYRGGSRTVHDVNDTKAYVYSCTIGDAVSNDKTLLLSGFSTLGLETCTLGYGDITFIDTFNDGGLTDLYIDSEATATNSELNQGWSYLPTGKYVVQTRRSSDDAVKSFTASEVADGTLENWLNNENLTSSLIVPTGVDTYYVVTDVIDASNYTIVANNTPATYWREIRSVPINTGQYRLTCTATITNCTSGGFRLRSNGGDLGDSQTPILVNGVHQIDLTVNVDGVGNLHWNSGAGTTGTLVVTNLAWELINADGHVRTWYDQSGSDNHAVQTDTTKQPKVVEGGNLLRDSNDKLEVRFDGTQFLGANGIASSVTGTDQPYSTFAVSKTNTTATQYLLGMGRATTSTPVKSILYYSGGNFGVQQRDNANTLKQKLSVSAYSTGTTYLTSTTSSGTVIDFSKNGSLDLDDFDVDVGLLTIDKVNIGAMANGDAAPLNGSISELIIYNSDQSDNRTAIEANIGETYGITDIPAADDTVNGFVHTWYDQSGEGNDAVQSAAANQPKIVGEVTSGQPHAFLGALVFDGSQQFQTITLTSSAQPNSIFSVSNTSVAGQTRGIYGTNANQAGYYSSSNKHAIYSSGTGAGTLEGSAYVVDTDYLRFDLFNGANSVVGVNGTTTSGTTGDAVLNRLDIGDASLGGVNPLNGGIKELILYTDDQSSNRPAIEANINNQYDIY